MTNILLTPYDGAILGPIAKLLGWIMNGIYMFMYDTFGIENVGLSIIILTILIYTLLLPFTIKQQKFSKLSQKMQPELNAIRDKYKGKKDEASMMAMNNETQMIYDKYGVSPMGSCVQMLIQMPILFALYRVFYNIPAYIDSVKDKFIVVADEIANYEGFADILAKIQTDFNIVTSVAPDFVISETNTIENVRNFIIDIIYKVPSLESLVTKNADGEVYFKSLESVNEIIQSGIEAFHEFNFFLGMNISDTPWNIIVSNFNQKNYLLVFAALAIPVASYLTQVLNIKLMPTSNNNNQNDMMTQQMNSMNKIMPFMSLFLCFTVPVGLGIYWVVSAAYRSVQQVILNRFFDNIDLEAIIEKNKDKAAKKREKMGVRENQIREMAAMNTKKISNNANVSTFVENERKIEEANIAKSNAKKGSLAAKANMVREYNERNSRK